MYWIDTNSNSSMRGKPAQINFYCDDPSDIDNLPTSSREGVPQADGDSSCKKCAKGSFCICIGDSSGWILNSNDEWIEV